MCLANNASASIKKLMRHNHVLQRDLARDIGMYPQTLSNKLHGKRPLTLRDVSRIADFFDVSIDSLLGREPLEVK